MSSKKFFFTAFTLLFSILMLTASIFLLADFEFASEAFLGIGISPILIFPVAMAQILGVLMLWLKIQFAAIKWVYIGFAIIFIFAGFSHLIMNDGFAIVPVTMGLILFLSYSFKTGFRELELTTYSINDN